MVVCKFPQPCWYRHNIQGTPRTFTTPNRWNSITVDRTPSLIDPHDTSYEQIGGTIGALIAGGIYGLSAPLTLIDGPLPYVDVVWISGLYRTAKTGYEVGSFVGEFVDMVF